MKNKYNVYSFIKFPNKKIRDKAKREYFDISKLRYSLDEYNKNLNQSDNIKLIGLNDFLNMEDNINTDFREKIRKINNQLFSCNVVLLRMFNYHETLNLDIIKDDRDLYEIIDLLYRNECVNLSFEIFNIIEKMKTILRIIYKLDLKASRKNDDFYKILKNIASNDSNLKSFIQLSEDLHKTEAYCLLNGLRDAEVHNIPTIDNVNWFVDLQDGSRAYVSPYYEINDNKLYISIKELLENLVIIKNAIQKIINSYKGEK